MKIIFNFKKKKKLNKCCYLELFEILKNYGEEPNADRIVKTIIEKRKEKLFETTTDLADIILDKEF